jgi:iron complex transport system permease protein
MQTQEEKKSRKLLNNGKIKWLLLILCPIIIFLVSLCIGRYSVSIDNILKILLSRIIDIPQTWPTNMTNAIVNVRLPRLIIVALVGASLSISGASYQGILKNPLVSPDILGVASGAGFGASLAIVLGLNVYMIQIFGFAFAMIAVGLAYGINSFYKSSSTLILVLCGVIISSFFSSLISLLKYVSDPNTTMAAIVFWLMGSFANVKWADIYQFGIPMFIGIVVLLLLRWRINVLSLDDAQAKALGINVKKYQGVIIFFTSLITASAVCISGIISWIGLLVPHIARMLVGPNNSKVLPASILIGVSLMLVIDDVARTISTAEISIGILTGIMAAPFFGYLLLRRKVGWS